jgi:hypothetical protein
MRVGALGFDAGHEFTHGAGRTSCAISRASRAAASSLTIEWKCGCNTDPEKAGP